MDVFKYLLSTFQNFPPKPAVFLLVRKSLNWTGFHFPDCSLSIHLLFWYHISDIEF